MSCDCSVDVDEMVDVCSGTWRVSRKEHRCCECDSAIVKGHRYLHESTLSYGHWTTYKTCAPCAAIRERYCSHGWEWGTLAETIQWCLGFDYRKVPGEHEASEIDAEDAEHVARSRRAAE
jgi:hypothetical protein